MKRILALVMTLVMCLAFAGLSHAEPNTEISGYIEVGGWPSGDDGFKAAMAGFNEMYPNIEVELVFTDTTSHHQSLQTSLASGQGAPDVAMVEGAYIAQYKNSLALCDLNAFGAQDYKDDFGPFKWNQAISDDGTHWRHALTLEDSPISQYSYPAVIQGKDDKLHCAYTWRRLRIAYKEIDIKKLK